MRDKTAKFSSLRYSIKDIFDFGSRGINVNGSNIKDRYACKYETTVNICFRRTDKQLD